MRRILYSLWKLWTNFNLLIRLEGYTRAKYIKKKNLFGSIGNNVYFHQWKLPADPKHIYIGDNVKISSEVLFVNHDILNAVFGCKNKTEKYEYYVGNIYIGDNVMVGTRTIILPDVRIGSNVIIGAGSVVTKDIPDGHIVAGNPAKKIGDFERLEKQRRS